jgi:hypothetical protein
VVIGLEGRVMGRAEVNGIFGTGLDGATREREKRRIGGVFILVHKGGSARMHSIFSQCSLSCCFSFPLYKKKKQKKEREGI